MLFAWSVTEVIRYSYFFVNLQGCGVPEWLTWLRYNTFYVLYPVGITSEWVLVVKASREAEGAEKAAWWLALGAYLPGEFLSGMGREGSRKMLIDLCRKLCAIYAHDSAEKEGFERKGGREEILTQSRESFRLSKVSLMFHSDRAHSGCHHWPQVNFVFLWLIVPYTQG